MRAGFLKPLADLISRRTKSPAPVVLHRRRAPRELKSRTTQSSVVWRSMQIRPYSNVRRRISARCSRNCISPSKRSARPLRAVSRLRNFFHFSRTVRPQRAGIVRLTLISAEARPVFAPTGGGLATPPSRFAADQICSQETSVQRHPIARLGPGGDFLDRDAGGELDQRHAAVAVLVDGEDAEVGDDEIHDLGAGQRQGAMMQKFRPVLGGVLHHHDDALDAGDQIHRPAHALDHLAGDHPVGEIAGLGHLHRPENGEIDVAAADHGEGIGAGEEAGGRQLRHRLLAGVDEVRVLIALEREGAHAEHAVFALQLNVDAPGNVVRHQGRNADAEVDVEAVLQLLGGARRAAVSLWTPWAKPQIAERWFSWPHIVIFAPVPIVTVLIAYWEWRSLNNRSEEAPFIGAVLLFVMSYLGIAISLFPLIVPYKFTLWDAASSQSTQAFFLVGTVFLLPIILMYTGWSYWVFRGKVRGDLGYH